MIPAWFGHHHMKPLQHSHDIPQWRIQGRDLGALVPTIFKPNWGPKGQKKYFGDRPPLPQLSKGLDLPLILCFAFQLHVQCLIVLFFCVSVKSFASVFSLTSCCSSRRNDSTQLVTSTYLMISERAWSRAAKKPGSIINAKKTSLFRLCSMILFL